MAGEQHLLSTEIVNRGIQSSGPDAGSLTFSVRVRRRLPDFLQSVNLKYVKLGYYYLINHGIYLATIPVLVLLVLSLEAGSLSREELWMKLCWDSTTRYDLATVLALFGVFVFTLSIFFMFRPRSIYLIDFACYKPEDDDLKATKALLYDCILPPVTHGAIVQPIRVTLLNSKQLMVYTDRIWWLFLLQFSFFGKSRNFS